MSGSPPKLSCSIGKGGEGGGRVCGCPAGRGNGTEAWGVGGQCHTVSCCKLRRHARAHTRAGSCCNPLQLARPSKRGRMKYSTRGIFHRFAGRAGTGSDWITLSHTASMGMMDRAASSWFVGIYAHYCSCWWHKYPWPFVSAILGDFLGGGRGRFPMGGNSSNCASCGMGLSIPHAL